MALADVYDALITKRVYKEAFSHETARGIIVDGRAKHFDPEIVDVFIEIEDTFQEIADQYSDNPAMEMTG
jgi:response regulator RpfG family c-di-GMP phosphodiesterase